MVACGSPSPHSWNRLVELVSGILCFPTLFAATSPRDQQASGSVTVPRCATALQLEGREGQCSTFQAEPMRKQVLHPPVVGEAATRVGECATSDALGKVRAAVSGRAKMEPRSAHGAPRSACTKLKAARCTNTQQHRSKPVLCSSAFILKLLVVVGVLVSLFIDESLAMGAGKEEEIPVVDERVVQPEVVPTPPDEQAPDRRDLPPQPLVPIIEHNQVLPTYPLRRSPIAHPITYPPLPHTPPRDKNSRLSQQYQEHRQGLLGLRLTQHILRKDHVEGRNPASAYMDTLFRREKNLLKEARDEQTQALESMMADEESTAGTSVSGAPDDESTRSEEELSGSDVGGTTSSTTSVNAQNPDQPGGT